MEYTQPWEVQRWNDHMVPTHRNKENLFGSRRVNKTNGTE